MASRPSANMLWGGRFTGGLDPLMVAYNESIYFDRANYAQDIRGSIAYARANSKIGILTYAEFSAIEKGFQEVLEEWKSGKFEIKPGVDEIFTPPMRGGWVRSSARELPESCIPGEAGMIRLARG